MPGRVALVSDLHSNIEALGAVLKDIESQKVDHIYCLGDIVGYGPNPREVLQIVSTRVKISIKGNHEEAVLFRPMDFRDEAQSAVHWTRDELNNPKLPKKDVYKLWDFLGNLGEYYEENDIQFLHGSPRDYLKEYVFPSDVKREDKLKDVFSKINNICFHGHSHQPGIFTDKLKFYDPKSCNSKIKLTKGLKYLINPGSVGQPRDGDPRSSYLIWEDDVITFRRVEYDFKKTMVKIFNTEKLPKVFAHRLMIGR